MVLRLPDFWSNWNLKMLFFGERGKPEYSEKNLSEQGREPTTNANHIWRRRRDLNPGHTGGGRAFSPLRHPLLPKGLLADDWSLLYISVRFENYRVLELPPQNEIQLRLFYRQNRKFAKKKKQWLRFFGIRYILLLRLCRFSRNKIHNTKRYLDNTQRLQNYGYS